MQEPTFESANINTKWASSIADNLLHIENMLRLSKEGCSNIIDFTNIPIDQRLQQLSDVQYKNIRFIITELTILLPKVKIKIPEETYNKFQLDLKRLREIASNRKLLIKESRNAKNEITSSYTTDMFLQLIDTISILHSDILNNISTLLYMEN